jgi:hypothetical protein
MLPGPNVFNMKAEQRPNSLFQSTILAAVVGPIANELSQGLIHAYCPFRAASIP